MYHDGIDLIQGQQLEIEYHKLQAVSTEQARHIHKLQNTDGAKLKELQQSAVKYKDTIRSQEAIINRLETMLSDALHQGTHKLSRNDATHVAHVR